MGDAERTLGFNTYAAAQADTRPAATAPAALGDRFTGTVERVVFFAEDTGYQVLCVGVKGHPGEIKCVGNAVERPSEGLEYQFAGAWTNDPKWGRQFKFADMRVCRPSSVAGLVRYLGSGVIHGIGASLAAALVDRFGLETLAVLDRCEAGLLREVPGIGRVKAGAIVEQWAAKVKYREVSIKLMSLGVSANLCVRIIKHFEQLEQEPWAGVMADPYCLTELWGVGFKTADAIGRKAGIGRRDPRRLRAACLYALQQARDNEGHCFLARLQLLKRIMAVCDIDQETVALWMMQASGDLCFLRSVVVEPNHDDIWMRYDEITEQCDPEIYYLARLHHDETVLAGCLKELADTALVPRVLLDVRDLQALFSEQTGYPLTSEQATTVYALMGQRLGVMTGGPGVGKTACTRALVMLAEVAGMQVALASPTGRAAKRLEEMTGHEAKTLHRLLGWSQSEHDFLAGPDNPLPHDLIIVDEASMVDVNLARALAAAINPTRTQLILVGDKDQLPSVGPGSVLNDVIASGRAEVRELTQIMRQAEGSGIVADAHAVNHGRMPALDWADCTFVAAEEAEAIQGMLLALAKGARAELQILTPMRKGPLGTVELNRVLQAALNPPGVGKPELVVGRGEKARTYRLGDRVLQTRNDYDRGCYNGDIGTISDVDVRAGEVTITMVHTQAVYGRQDLKDVDLAYCMTIHKAQGSEYENVVVVQHWSHYIMLSRTLLYTGMTRAKKMLTVIGEQRAVERSVSNNRSAKRNTRLSERMSG